MTKPDLEAYRAAQVWLVLDKAEMLFPLTNGIGVGVL
jgi:hypothetical protein